MTPNAQADVDLLPGTRHTCCHDRHGSHIIFSAAGLSAPKNRLWGSAAYPPSPSQPLASATHGCAGKNASGLRRCTSAFSLAASGRFGEGGSLSNQWRANALVSSTANSFAGTSFFDNAGDGDFRGAFFGPGAEEVGATFQVGGQSGRTLVGALIGTRGATAINRYTSFENTSPQRGDAIFATAAASFEAQLDGAGRVVAASSAPRLVGVYLEEFASQPITYSGDGRINRFLPGQSQVGLTYAGSPVNSTTDPFVSFQTIDKRTATARIDQALFGFPTTTAGVPRTGSGSFNVGLSGAAAILGRTLETLTGSGALSVDFATGLISTLGTYQLSDRQPDDVGPPGTTTDSGIWTGAAQLSSAENAFAGTLALDGTRDFSGAWNGLFYGAGASHVGAILELTSADGGRIAGKMQGARGSGAGASQTPLAQLSASTALQAADAQYLVTPSLSPSVSTTTFGAVTVTYDPVGGTYRLQSDPGAATSGGVAIDRTLARADIDAAAGDARFTAYRTPQFTARVFKFDGTNPAITLSYTSFATLSETVDNRGRQSTVQHYIPFGGQTPAFQMPRTGTGQYAGVVFGSGYNGATGRDASLSGTSAFAVDFGAGTASMVLALTTTDAVSGAASSLGNVTFGGNLGGFCPGGCPTNAFALAVTGGASTGSMNGLFYGPNAAEFGAAFRFDISSPNGQSSSSSTFAGVTVGKRN